MNYFIHRFVILIAAFSIPAAAQETDIPGAKAVMPTLAEYPDRGQSYDMQWTAWGETETPRVDFGTPETDNRLWTIRCNRAANGRVRIVHQIEAVPRDMGSGDRFGFSIRVDKGSSLGLIARMELANGEGGQYYVPRFYTANRHALYVALAKGSRAYINLNGNKFSVHLKGSGDAIKSFLKRCR
jgi:hypothetical protein